MTMLAAAPADTAVPVGPVRRAPVPIVVALSLLAHAALVLLLLLAGHGEETPVRETAVEVITLPEPPKPPPQPLPKPSQQPAPKKAAEPPKEAAKPPPQQAAPKPAPPKPAPKPTPKATPKPVQAKPAQLKPQPSPKPAPADPQDRTATQSVSDRMAKLLGSMPALAVPSSAADGTDVVSYSEGVLGQVARAKKDGRHQGIPGAASVAFTIGDHGEIVSCTVVRKSVDPALDAEAIAMIRRAAPYPPPPPGARRAYVITLRFQAL